MTSRCGIQTLALGLVAVLAAADLPGCMSISFALNGRMSLQEQADVFEARFHPGMTESEVCRGLDELGVTHEPIPPEEAHMHGRAVSEGKSPPAAGLPRIRARLLTAAVGFKEGSRRHELPATFYFNGPALSEAWMVNVAEMWKRYPKAPRPSNPEDGVFLAAYVKGPSGDMGLHHCDQVRVVPRSGMTRVGGGSISEVRQ